MGRARKRGMTTSVASSGRRARRRPGLRHLAYLVIAALGVVICMAALELSRLFADAGSFELVALEVDGLRLLTGDDVLVASGLELGTDLFDVDLAAVSARIEALPWVRRALVLRKPPNRLVVSLVERRRVAWLHAGGYYGVDDEGVLLPPKREGEGHGDLNLPVISGIAPPDSLIVGAPLPAPRLHQLLNWWRVANAADPEFCLNVSEMEAIGPRSRSFATDDIDWKAGGLRLRLVGDGLEVRLPWQPVSEQLQVLKGVMERLYRDLDDPAYVDLRYAGQVIVGSADTPS